jgi:hypothetical protein
MPAEAAAVNPIGLTWPDFALVFALVIAMLGIGYWTFDTLVGRRTFLYRHGNQRRYADLRPGHRVPRKS